MPSAWRRTTSSRLMPAPNRSARAQRPPIDRAATSSTHSRSPSARSSAWIGPSERPIAAAASPTILGTAASDASGSDGWRHVDRLLEVRAGRRVGLVEHREDLELAAAQQPLDRDLRTGDELLDEERRVSRDLGGTLRRGSRARRVVGADDAAARGEPDRLDDHGKPRRRRGRRGAVADRRSRRSAVAATSASASARRIAALSRVRATASGGL